jgi:hypothetical protein
MGAVETSDRPIESSRDVAVEAIDRIAFASSARSVTDDTMAMLDQAAQTADAAFPDRAVASRLGWDYPAQAALTEINGAKVRILSALDEFEEVGPDDFIPEPARQHWKDACTAAWDLGVKISRKAAAAPSALDRVKGGLEEGAGGLGDALGAPIAAFLEKLLANLWWVLLVVGVVVLVLVVRPGGLLRAAAVAVPA